MKGQLKTLSYSSIMSSWSLEPCLCRTGEGAPISPHPGVKALP